MQAGAVGFSRGLRAGKGVAGLQLLLGLAGPDLACCFLLQRCWNGPAFKLKIGSVDGPKWTWALGPKNIIPQNNKYEAKIK